MTGTTTSADAYRLADRLDRVTTAATRLFAVAVALALLAFLTNPQPTQDLPGMGLPVTLPVTQPHWGHSAASYLVGMWLFEFTFPFAVLAAARRWGTSERRVRRLLVGLPVGYMAVALAYCHLHYLPNVTPTPLGPATNALCWAYCATGAPVWGAATLAVVGVGVAAWLAATRDHARRGTLAVAFGVLSLPLGVPAIWWGLQHRQVGGQR